MFSWYGSRFFFKYFVTIPVAPIITRVIIHFMFHIRFISIHPLVLFSFLLPFEWQFCLQLLPHPSVCMFSFSFFFFFFFLIVISNICAVTSLSACIPWFHYTITPSCSHTGLCVCVCFAVVTMPSALRIQQWQNKQTLSCVTKYSFFARMEHHGVRWPIVSSCCLQTGIYCQFLRSNF